MTTKTAPAAQMTLEQLNARQAALTPVFDLVADPSDWRAAIDCNVDLSTADAPRLDDIREAVEWFTATTAEITHVAGPVVRVRSVGYRMGPAGP